MREKPKMVLLNKSKRKKWYSVFAKFEWEEKKERAKFLHPGDAYKYAAGLFDEWEKYAERLELIEVEC